MFVTAATRGHTRDWAVTQRICPHLAATTIGADGRPRALVDGWAAVFSSLETNEVGLDEWAADNLVAYLSEQVEATGSVPDGRQMIRAAPSSCSRTPSGSSS